MDRKELELFAYLLRVLLTVIVDQALRFRTLDRTLQLLTTPISVENYDEAVQLV